MSAKIRILAILARHGREMIGADIVKEDPKLSMGTIYNHLYTLQLEGNVTSRAETTDEIMARLQAQQVERTWALPRRFYKITPSGRTRLAEKIEKTGNLGNFGLQGT